jgi:hypothetical protein
MQRAGPTVQLTPIDPDLSRPRILRVSTSVIGRSSCPDRLGLANARADSHRLASIHWIAKRQKAPDDLG